MSISSCLSCELMKRRVAGNAPLWDDIYRTELWSLVHAYNSSLLGWLVLIPQRHSEAIDELSDAEAAELGPLLQRVSNALKATTGCVKTYVVQFAEQKEHPHVHFHIVARMADQPEDFRGPKIFGYLKTGEEGRVSEAAMNQLADQIREILTGHE